MFGALYVLHQDSWFWRTANPLVFGFIPIGLFYHGCYTLATAFALLLLVKHAWPSELEGESSADFSLRDSDSVDSDRREPGQRLKPVLHREEGPEP